MAETYIGNCRTNQHTARDSVQFVIRGWNSSVIMEISKHFTIVKKRFKKQVREQ